MKTRHTGRLQLPPLEKEAVQRHASLRRLPSRGRAPTGSEYMRQAIADGADIEEDMDEEVYEEGHVCQTFRLVVGSYYRPSMVIVRPNSIL